MSEFDLAVAVRRRPCRMIDDRSRRQAGQEHRSGPSAGHSAIVLIAVATAAMIDATLAAVAAAATGLAVGIVVAAIVAVAAETSTDQALHKLVQTPRSPRDFGQESQTRHDRVWGPSAGANSAESAGGPCLAASTDVASPGAWVDSASSVQMPKQIETAGGDPRKQGRQPSLSIALAHHI